MASYTIHSLDMGNPFFVDLDKEKNIKTCDLKKYMSDYFGIDTDEMRLFIRCSKTNKMIEKTDGDFFEGTCNRYLFTINPLYNMHYLDEFSSTDSIDDLLSFHNSET